MSAPHSAPLLLLLALACGPGSDKAEPGEPALGEDSGGASDSGGGRDSGEPAPDPLSLAALVSVDELGATIGALADFGTRHLTADNHDEVRGYLVDRLEALGLDTETDRFTARGAPAGNVIARLPGTDPSTVWIFQAHFDSTSELAPETAPGADDNASGCAAVLEAARLLRDLPLRDSVWFIFTDAEEQGSLGSAFLVETLAGEDLNIKGVIAPDMIGYWPAEERDAFDILGDEDSADLVSDMAAVADALGIANKTWVNHSYCYGDDHTNWQEAGYPAITPMDCVESHNDSHSHEDLPHYHRSTDTLDTVYLPFTARVTGVIVATLAGWAMGA